LETPTGFLIESDSRFIDLSGGSVAYLLLDNVYTYCGHRSC
jgi:hypothetical protein